MSIMDAAQVLITQLHAPAVAHSVWVRAKTELDQDGKPRATGKQELCISIRPGWKSKIKIPAQCNGFPVVEVPWPKGS